jgi:DNA repair exonuclease SbcCD ATPase subunit
MSNADEHKNANGQAADGAGGAENVDRIREILFGTQQRDFEKKLARIEDRLATEVNNLREEYKKRFDSLQVFLKDELEAVTERIKAEQDERVEKLAQISRELKEFSKQTEKRITHLDEQQDKHQRDVRKQILDQGEGLSQDFRRQHQELKTAVDASLEELAADKPSRGALANMFTEMALRLNNEFNIPGAETGGKGETRRQK